MPRDASASPTTRRTWPGPTGIFREKLRALRYSRKDKTFAPRSHGDTEGKDEWVPSGPVGHEVSFRADRRNLDRVSRAERGGHGKQSSGRFEEQGMEPRTDHGVCIIYTGGT